MLFTPRIEEFRNWSSSIVSETSPSAWEHRPRRRNTYTTSCYVDTYSPPMPTGVMAEVEVEEKVPVAESSSDSGEDFEMETLRSAPVDPIPSTMSDQDNVATSFLSSGGHEEEVSKETTSDMTLPSGAKILQSSHRPRATSTPTNEKLRNMVDSASGLASSCSASDEGVGLTPDEQGGSTLSIINSDIQVPIVGYEVMESRARFTVFKINIKKGPHESWFVFRRYSDFVRLNYKLSVQFPGFRLALPPKKWFGNFNPDFLEDRQLGLQAFMNNIVGHRDIAASTAVREFLCLDDPPGPHDSLEESRAMCESLEDMVYSLRRDVQERDSKIDLLEGEVAMLRAELEALQNTVKFERTLNSMRRSPTGSLPESGDYDNDCTSCVEADQGQHRRQTHTPPVSPSLTTSYDAVEEKEDLKLKRVTELDSTDFVPGQTEIPTADIDKNLNLSNNNHEVLAS